MNGFPNLIFPLLALSAAAMPARIPKARRAYVEVQIGNTCKVIPREQARLSRTGQPKVYVWELSAQPVSGDPNAIRRVELFPDIVDNTYLPESYGRETPPFQWRKDAWGTSTYKVLLYMADGRVKQIANKIKNTNTNSRKYWLVYDKTRVPTGSKATSVISDRAFGVEIELASDGSISVDDLRRHLAQTTNETVLALGYTKDTMKAWKIVSDDSIGTGVEIVSPILRGEQGLSRLRTAVESLNDAGGLSATSSCGLHVHVDLTGIDIHGLKRICQNWIKYEKAIDLVLPPSRRANVNRYCRSARHNDLLKDMSNKAAHERVMNADKHDRKRYFELNMQNLVTGKKKNALEFRGHSGTCDSVKIENWVRFLNAFVEGSLKQPSVLAFPDHCTPEDAFEGMFKNLIRDGALHDFFDKRREKFCLKTLKLPTHGHRVTVSL
jgi:hypothetical protein